MTPEQWRHAKEIIASALEFPKEEREAFLDRACSEDAPLRAEIGGMMETFADDSLLLPGDVVDGQYRIEKMLGTGGFGTTWLARDLQLLDRPVVVKVLRHGIGDRSLDSDLQHEMKTLAALNHPGVVAPLAHGRLPNGEPYLVMQFVDGSTLSSLISKGGIPFDRAASILRQIGNALGAVHGRKILHRDLKPGNIMIQAVPGGDHVCLIDFGIARALPEEAVTGVYTRPAGSLRYMAPEQFLGKSGKASDIYAMSVVAFELLTGERPLPAGKHGASGTAMAEEKTLATLRPDLPRPAAQLIEKGLGTDPGTRPADAAAFGEDLSRALAGRSRAFAMPFVWLVLLLIVAASAASWVAVRMADSRAPASTRLHVVLRVESPGGQVRRISGARVTLGENETFRFEMAPEGPGYLYMLTEPDRPSAPLTILFPSVTTNRYSSFLTVSNPATRPVLIPEKSPLAFRSDRRASLDRVWIVWSRGPQRVLEDAGRWARLPYAGVIGDRAQAASVRDVLVRLEGAPDTTNGDLVLGAGAPTSAVVMEIHHF